MMTPKMEGKEGWLREGQEKSNGRDTGDAGRKKREISSTGSPMEKQAV